MRKIKFFRQIRKHNKSSRKRENFSRLIGDINKGFEKSAINFHHSCVIDAQEFIKSCDFGNTLRLALGFFLDDEMTNLVQNDLFLHYLLQKQINCTLGDRFDEITVKWFN